MSAFQSSRVGGFQQARAGFGGFGGFGMGFQPQVMFLQEPEIRIAETMLLDDVPVKARNLFIELFNSIKETSAAIAKLDFPSWYSMEQTLTKLSHDVISCARLDLTNCARKLDAATDTVDEMAADLEAARGYVHSAANPRMVPTRFIQDMAERLRQRVQDLESRASGHFELDDVRSNGQVIEDLLRAEEEAFARAGAVVAQLQGRVRRTQDAVNVRFSMETENLPYERPRRQLWSDRVRVGLTREIEQQRRRWRRPPGVGDAFGRVPQPPPMTTAGTAAFGSLNFGGAFGAGRTFGAGASAFGAKPA